MSARARAGSDAVVVVREDEGGHQQLVGYVQVRAPAPTVEELRTHLQGRLPGYMVPGALVPVEGFARTHTGKIDRRALPAPSGLGYVQQEYEEPRGQYEEIVAGLWQELLGVERVGRQANFFELGGHSLLAMRMLARVEVLLQRQLPLGEVFAYPTVRELALRLRGADEREPIAVVSRAQSLPLSLSQQRLWFIDQLEGAGAAYHIAWRCG